MRPVRMRTVVREDGVLRVESDQGSWRLWLMGYGDWTGYASATLVEATRTARELARNLLAALDAEAVDIS